MTQPTGHTTSTHDASSGYRTFTLPDLLPGLERKDQPSTNSGLSLIAADRITLVWSQTLQDGTRAVLKMYRNHGFFSRIREKLARFRVQREFDSLTYLDSLGIPCSKPLFWTYGCNEQYGRYEILATREIPGSVRLDVFIRSEAHPENRKILADAYAMLRRLHEAGFHHGAMYERNILISQVNAQKPPALFIIDTPKAMRFPYSIAGTRMAWIDIAHLSRSLLHFLGPEETATWLSHYGMDKEEIARFMACLQKYHPNRHTRNRDRAECEMWEFLSRLGIRCPAGRA